MTRERPLPTAQQVEAAALRLHRNEREVLELAAGGRAAFERGDRRAARHSSPRGAGSLAEREVTGALEILT